MTWFWGFKDTFRVRVKVMVRGQAIAIRHGFELSVSAF